MTEAEKKGIEKSKIGLLASIVIIVILVISSLWLYTRVNILQNQVNILKAPKLHVINVRWVAHHPLFAATPSYISISGTIRNSGRNPAYNVVLTVKIYDSSDTLLKSEELSLGTISGKSYKNFHTTIEYSGYAEYITTTLTYD